MWRVVIDERGFISGAALQPRTQERGFVHSLRAMLKAMLAFYVVIGSMLAIGLWELAKWLWAHIEVTLS